MFVYFILLAFDLGCFLDMTTSPRRLFVCLFFGTWLQAGFEPASDHRCQRFPTEAFTLGSNIGVLFYALVLYTDENRSTNLLIHRPTRQLPDPHSL